MGTGVSIAIMACNARRAPAEALANQVGACAVTYDDNLDLWGNRRAALLKAYADGRRAGYWCLVLQDDVRVVAGFGQRLSATLSSPPPGAAQVVNAGGLLSLFLGRRVSMMRWWLTAVELGAYVPVRGMSYPQWGQGLMLPASRVLDLIRFGDAFHMDHRYDDTRCIKWACHAKVPLAYLVPSLVEHVDTPSVLLGGQPRGERRALWFADDPLPDEIQGLADDCASIIP